MAILNEYENLISVHTYIEKTLQLRNALTKGQLISKSERKQFDMRYHNTALLGQFFSFFRSFFGRI